jgi:acetyl esterase/lipase
VFLGALPVDGPVGTLAFGKYRSPDYETSDQFIPPVGTRSGVPAGQGEHDIFFNLFLPSGHAPPEGWPVVIYGHGGGGSKQTRRFLSPLAWPPRDSPRSPLMRWAMGEALRAP